MCFELPFKIVSIKDKKAKADYDGCQQEVSLVLVNNVKIGDYVLVKGGYAVSKIRKEEAKEIINLLKNENNL